MMGRIIIPIVIFVLFAAQSRASEYRREPEPPPPQETSTQTQDMAQDQSQSMDQQQSLIGGDNSAIGGNAEATGGSAEATGGTSTAQGGEGGNVGDVTTSINYKRPHQNAPTVVVPSVYPTTSCFKPSVFGLTVPGYGGSAGACRSDEGCVRRELIRLAPESHKLYLFCYEPTVLTLFDDHQTCLDHNKEVMPDDARDQRSGPEVYDDTALAQQIEALVARVGAVETTSRETKVIATESKEFAVAAYEAPFEAVRAEHRKIQKVEK